MSVQFRGSLTLHWRGEEWETADTLTCIWDTDDDLYIVTVPAGFKTDLASIPRLFRSLIPQVGRWNRPAVVHDWLYEDGVPRFTRAMADRLFYEGRRAEGGSWFTARGMWAAGGAFGWTLWE